ncbi:MAG: hypothetical protein HGB36_13070 [Chlorobiaceae bacterium]|nr:hypothetical protein [Chlorobiaceae bacterium]
MKKRTIKITLLLLGVFITGNPAIQAEAKNKLKSEVVQNKEAAEVSADTKGGKSENATVQVSEPVTREELEGVRAELATLQERLDRTYERNTAQTQRPLIITGVAQLRYTNTENNYFSSVIGNKNNRYNGFSLNALILNFQGNLKRDFEEGRNINYLFSVVTPGTLTSSYTNDYAVRPLDAYITKQIFQTLDPEKSQLSVTFGQQKKPFGLEAGAAEDKKPTILSAQSARANTYVNGLGDASNGANAGAFPLNGLGLDTRDIGIVIKGDLFPHFDPGFRYRVAAVEYAFGILNGSGPNAQDNNGRKDFSGRIVLNAPVDYSSIFRGLSVGASYYNGRNYANGIGEYDVKRWGADIAYVNTPIGFTYEYVHGQDYFAKQKEGHTLTVFYNLGQQFVTGYKYQDRYDDWYPTTFQPFVRFDWWNTDTSVDGWTTEITTIGINWFLAQTTKLQVNYNIINQGSKAALAFPGARNQFLAQIQYSF